MTIAVVLVGVWFVWPGAFAFMGGRLADAAGVDSRGGGVPSFEPWARGFGGGAQVTPGAGAPGWTGLVVRDARVERIIDGDTLDVRGPAGVVRVRLLGVDTPERGACWWREATAALADLAPVGTRVTVATDRSQGDRDRYGRLLGYVYTAGVDGPDSVSRDLLGRGVARVYRSRRPVAFAAAFRAAEAQARSARLGVWRYC